MAARGAGIAGEAGGEEELIRRIYVLETIERDAVREDRQLMDGMAWAIAMKLLLALEDDVYRTCS